MGEMGMKKRRTLRYLITVTAKEDTHFVRSITEIVETITDSIVVVWRTDTNDLTAGVTALPEESIKETT